MKRWSGIEGDFLDTLFAFQNFPDATPANGNGLNIYRPRGSAEYLDEYALEALVEPHSAGLSMNIQVNPKCFSRAQATLILDELDFTLTQLCHGLNKELTASTLWALSPTQTQLIDAASYGPQAPLPYELLHHGFEEKARLCPDLRAVEYEGEWISYGDLNSRAKDLALELAGLGVSVGSRVAVIMDRCLEFPIGLLAALKVGATVMPLDVSFPAARLSFIVLDARATVLVTTGKHKHHLLEMRLEIPLVCTTDQLILLEDDFQPTQKHIASRFDEAFIVYTSGSTGKPKGVPVLHAGAVNNIVNSAFDAKIREGTRVMQFMAIGFDACQWELWKTISSGATLVFRTDDIQECLKNIDVIMCTPTALALFEHPSKYPHLKCVCVAGEAVPSQLMDLWSPYVCFMNVYGPTECSIASHFVKLEESVNVGAPITNVNSYILDANKRFVPIGATGEMYLGGICVSSGYINLPEQTSERFLPDPFVGGNNRMFRTGDMARLLPNGNFEVLGRQDSQVKLKGYRIELDEVAEAMMEHPGVVAAAAIVKDKTHLVGYFSPAAINVQDLEQTVASHLPVYMVPAVWVGLNEMPQNVNGKIDKKALQSLRVELEVSSLETDAERTMANVWADVLNVDVSEIGRRTSFFALGGDSITAIRLVARAKQMGLGLTSASVMKHATLENMARVAKCIDYNVKLNAN
ncbi:hypothetical protein As57867_005713, partial [Aphanomyces stellatus]